MKPHIRLHGVATPTATIEDPYSRDAGLGLPDTAHEAASSTRSDVRSWNPPRRSADGAWLPEQQRVMGRARDIQRNNGVAQGGVQTLVDNVVGTGMRLGVRPNWKLLERSETWL